MHIQTHILVIYRCTIYVEVYTLIIYTCILYTTIYLHIYNPPIHISQLYAVRYTYASVYIDMIYTNIKHI